MRYFGNGSGRDSYIIKSFGGMLRPRRSRADEGATGDISKDFKYGSNKVDRMFGRLPDSCISNMVKALKSDQ